MNLPNILPPSDLLKQVEGVEDGLRKLRRLGGVGHWGFWLSLVFEIVAWVLAHPPPSAPAWWKTQLEPRAQAFMWIAGLVAILFLTIWTWSNFWLQQSRQPFRYTCHVGDFTALGEDAATLPKWRVWLAHDLARLLSERIGRLQFLDPPPSASPPGADGEKGREHVEISGVFGVRTSEADGIRAIEVLPSVRIGTVSSAWTLAHRVVFAPEDDEALTDGIKKGRDDYIQLLERVYFSVASEVYRKIAEDVMGKIALIPTKWLRALALFHEAEDYARSSTLLAHEEAGRLYRLSAETLDLSLRELPRRQLARSSARVARWCAARRSAVLRLLVYIFPSFSQRAILCARALTGSANMALYQRMLAAMSGQKPNSIFEARRYALEAVKKLESVESDPVTPEVRHATFDARVALALAHSLLGSAIKARVQLDRARGLAPGRAGLNPRFLVAAGWIHPQVHMRSQLWQRALELEPRFEAAHFLVGAVFEDLWRSRHVFERSPAEQFVLSTYRSLSLANPSILASWAAVGYTRWLLGEDEDLVAARRAFLTARQYKEIKQTSFVADIDLGLARIAAENGRFTDAYRHYAQATAALIAHAASHGGDPAEYHFRLIGPALFARFQRYRENVEKHLADPASLGRLSPRAIRAVYAFVLADYADACYRYFAVTRDGRQLELAIAAIDLALEVNPNSSSAHFQRLRIFRWLPGLDDAQQAARAASRQRLENLAPTWIAAQDLLTELDAIEIRGWVERETKLPTEIKEAQDAVPKLRLQGLEPDGPAASQVAHPPADSASRDLAPGRSRRTASALARKQRANELLNARHRLSQLKAELRALPEKIRRNKALILDRTRKRVPHRELWLERDKVNFNWALLDLDESSGGIYWERDLDDLHVRALQAYASTLAGGTVEDRAHSRRLFQTISARFWPDDPFLLNDCDWFFPDDEDAPRRHAAWRAIIADQLVNASSQAHILLDWAYPKWVVAAPAYQRQRLESHAAFLDAVELALDNPYVAPAAAFQLGLVLEQIAAKRDDKSDTAKQLSERASKAARRAADATLKSDDPSTLCDAAQHYLENDDLSTATAALARLRSLESGVSATLAVDREAALEAAKNLGENLVAGDAAGLRKIASALVPLPRPLRPARELSARLGGRWLLRGEIDRARCEFDALTTKAPCDDYWRTLFAGQLAKARDAAPLVTLRGWLKTEKRPADCPGADRDALAADLALIRRREAIARGASPEPALLFVDPLVIELDDNFFPEAAGDPNKHPFFIKVSLMRLDIERDLGVRIPRLLVRGNDRPEWKETWQLSIDETPIISGQAHHPDWVPQVIEPVEKELRKRCTLFFGVQEFAQFLRTWKSTGDAAETTRRAKLVEVAVGDPKALRRCAQVLAGLLRESVSIADLNTILAEFARLAPHQIEPAAETEILRRSLRDSLPGNRAGIPLFKLGTALEDDIADAVCGQTKTALAIEPLVASRFVDAVGNALRGVDTAAVIAERPGIRRFVRRLIEFEFPNAHVLAAAELTPATAARTPILIDYPSP